MVGSHISLFLMEAHLPSYSSHKRNRFLIERHWPDCQFPIGPGLVDCVQLTLTDNPSRIVPKAKLPGVLGSSASSGVTNLQRP